MRRLPKPKTNLLERAIAAVAPTWAYERHRARGMMALSGGYTGAGYRDNLFGWRPGTTDADAASLQDLPELRNRSHDLVRNSPIAGGAIETMVANVVGSGLTMQPQINCELLGLDDDAAEEWECATAARWCLWAESELADAFGQQTFYELQDLVFRSQQESGDVFPVLADKPRPGWPFRLAIQVVEADRVSNPLGQQDTPTLVQGIERAPDGEAIAVHIADRHPGSRLQMSLTKWTRVEIRGQQSGRRNVLHLYRKLRPGQTRGVPALAPIVEQLKQLTRYSEAEIDAAVNSAAMAVFVKMDHEAFEDLFTDESKEQIITDAQKWDGTLGKGAAVNLLPGESIESPSPGRPNVNFDGFVGAVMKQIGMGLNIPVEVLTKHFSSSYSAARAALLDAWRTFKIRRAWLAAKFCQPVYEEWLADEVAAGTISAPGFFVDPMLRKAWCGAQWVGDAPGAIDPLKEVKAAQLRMSEGITTLPEEIVAYDGGSWERKHTVAARVRTEREEAGLQAPVTMPMPGAAAPPGQAMPDPEDATGDAGDAGDGQQQGDDGED